MGGTTLTIRVDERTKERLDKLAQSLDRSKSYIITHALEDFLEINEWQIKEIKAGIKEAKAGRVVEHEKVLTKWKAKLAHPVD
ncbi:MAG: CopG family ribbon-helix-helix protein [Nitrospirota bacterium]